VKPAGTQVNSVVAVGFEPCVIIMKSCIRKAINLEKSYKMNWMNNHAL
jgi:hypothetical protein